jgi:predicted nuclease of restriction endonuclease-like (RecB) superfamily
LNNISERRNLNKSLITILKIKEEFSSVINTIKKEIKNTQIKMYVQTNKNLINLYFKLGKILNDNFSYGNKFIDDISQELRLEFPNLKGFSVRNLKYMKKFYLEYKDDKAVQQVVAQLPCRHNIILMSKLSDNKIRKIYAEATIKNGWSSDVLVMQIESNFHLRIGNSYNNFNISLKDIDSEIVNNTIKDPYIFDFLILKENYKEKELEIALIEKIKDVLVELGKGFSFVGNQYKISTDNNDYYIDLLFYHLDLRCYIVIELKTTEFRPEYIGQLGFYVTAVNEMLKKETDNQTIGLLLCKDKDRLTAKWSLKITNIPIGISSYELDKYVPKEMLEKLPTEDDLNLHIDLRE